MSAASGRHAYLDWARGLAVLVMVAVHVLDSWTRADERARTVFGYIMIVGGMGAPMFLFLAGVSVVLSAEAKRQKSGDARTAWRAVQRRGWQIFGLAFLFRVQSFLLTGAQFPSSLLKVDILNIMGPAIAATAALGALVRTHWSRGVLFAVTTAAIAMLTPLVRATPLLDPVFDPVEWYLRPSPGRTNFTLFPWAAFVPAGAVAGVAIYALGPGSGRLQAALAVSGLLIGWMAYEASFLPSIYARSDFWTSSPTYFFIRVALLLLLVPVAWAWDRVKIAAKLSGWSPLQEFGRASLFVYWIHVEMVYGVFSRPLRRGLSLEAAALAVVLFTVFLMGLVLLKNRLVRHLSN